MIYREKKNILVPLCFCFLVRLIVYFFAIRHGHFFEGDSVRYIGYMDELLGRGTIDGGNWNAPGYFLFEALNYKILHGGHYSLLAFQNVFDLVFAYWLMREVRQSSLACWAIALIGTCDLATVMYANAVMTEGLTSVLFSLGVFLAFKKNRMFWSSFFFGLSCVVRGGNWPIYLVFLFLVALKRRAYSIRAPVLLILGALVTIGPAICYNGLRFHHWNLASQGEYHAVTIGAGIIMRQKNVSWAQGEKDFNAYHEDLRVKGELSTTSPESKTRMQALRRYISENKKAFAWSVVRGFATQFVGGQNAEIMHRFSGREIEREPLPPLVHRTMIGAHALWMSAVWLTFIWAVVFLWQRRQERWLVAFTVLALTYFFLSVATLGSARFRIPCMASVALCVALALKTREHPC